VGELPGEKLSMIGKAISHHPINEKLGQNRMGEDFLAEYTSLAGGLPSRSCPKHSLAILNGWLVSIGKQSWFLTARKG
jgi:hypothetical protein